MADYVVIGELIPNRTMVRSLAFWNQGAVASNFEYGLKGTPCADVLARPGTLVFPQHVTAIFPQDRELRDLRVEGYVGTSLFGSHGNVLGILVAMSCKPIAHPSLWASVLEICALRSTLLQDSRKWSGSHMARPSPARLCITSSASSTMRGKWTI